MYSFDGVTLDRKNGEYIVAVDGIEVVPELEAHQRRNPILAANRFATAVSTKMRRNVQKYLKSTGANAVTGCKVDMPCRECQRAGLNLRSANCIFENAKEDYKNE